MYQSKIPCNYEDLMKKETMVVKFPSLGTSAI
jgi:hypothetical protein